MELRGNKQRALRLSDDDFEKIVGLSKAHDCKYLSDLIKKINKGELIIIKNPLDR